MLVENIFLSDEEATVNFGKSLISAILKAQSCRKENKKSAENKALIVYLNGDLGTGKTTLSRGVMRGLGHEGAVKSPTYTLVEPYETESGNVYHFDLYRLSDPEEVEYMGVEDYFQGNNVCLIEWPEQGEKFLPAPDLYVQLSESRDSSAASNTITNENAQRAKTMPGRSLRLEARTELGEQIVCELTAQ